MGMFVCFGLVSRVFVTVLPVFPPVFVAVDVLVPVVRVFVKVFVYVLVGVAVFVFVPVHFLPMGMPVPMGMLVLMRMQVSVLVSSFHYRILLLGRPLLRALFPWMPSARLDEAGGPFVTRAF